MRKHIVFIVSYLLMSELLISCGMLIPDMPEEEDRPDNFYMSKSFRGNKCLFDNDMGLYYKSVFTFYSDIVDYVYNLYEDSDCCNRVGQRYDAVSYEEVENINDDPNRVLIHEYNLDSSSIRVPQEVLDSFNNKAVFNKTDWQADSKGLVYITDKVKFTPSYKVITRLSDESMSISPYDFGSKNLVGKEIVFSLNKDYTYPEYDEVDEQESSSDDSSLLNEDSDVQEAIEVEEYTILTKDSSKIEESANINNEQNEPTDIVVPQKFNIVTRMHVLNRLIIKDTHTLDDLNDKIFSKYNHLKNVTWPLYVGLSPEGIFAGSGTVNGVYHKGVNPLHEANKLLVDLYDNINYYSRGRIDNILKQIKENLEKAQPMFDQMVDSLRKDRYSKIYLDPKYLEQTTEKERKKNKKLNDELETSKRFVARELEQLYKDSFDTVKTKLNFDKEIALVNSMILANANRDDFFDGKNLSGKEIDQSMEDSKSILVDEILVQSGVLPFSTVKEYRNLDEDEIDISTHYNFQDSTSFKEETWTYYYHIPETTTDTQVVKANYKGKGSVSIDEDGNKVFTFVVESAYVTGYTEYKDAYKSYLHGGPSTEHRMAQAVIEGCVGKVFTFIYDDNVAIRGGEKGVLMDLHTPKYVL